jgi:ribosomal protein S1
MPFGIFVRVYLSDEDKTSGVFLDGLVHISEISWEKVSDVSRLFEVDNEISVQVIDVDTDSGKLNLSIKRLTENPWDKLGRELPVESKTKGKVTRLAPYGAFVRLDQGVEGLIHISKIPSEADLSIGDEVNVYIESIDVDNHRISLGLVLSAKPVGYK